jgi:hypothetical protein
VDLERHMWVYENSRKNSVAMYHVTKVKLPSFPSDNRQVRPRIVDATLVDRGARGMLLVSGIWL